MEDPVVKLQSGLVRGVIEKHEEGFSYYAFKGIPFAEPPVDELRFEDPVPIKKWKGIRDCKTYGPRCLQHDIFFNINCYDEDCLHLNVFTKSIKNSKVSSPVMVVVHASGFTYGCSDDAMYGPEYLIRKDIVLVTVNYRLGVLGFLNLEDEVAPGNKGLKDLVLALQWVQQNIQTLGGDPKNVTLFGMTSGGSLVHALALSSQTKGLIHKVISQGCTLFNPWMSIDNPKSMAIKLCSLLGKELTDSREILKFLKSVDAKSLQEAQEKLRKSIETLPFSIGIDSKSPNPIMPVHRYLAGNKAVHLPYLLGYNADEGVVMLIGSTKEEFFKMCNQDFRKIYKYNSWEVSERYNLSDEQVRRLYFKKQEISENTQKSFIDYGSDYFFLEAVHKAARVQAELSSAPTYLYKFTYDTPTSFVKSKLDNKYPGATHFDDTPFLFKTRAFERFGFEYFKKGTTECKIMEQMTEMYANFAKHGRPTISKSDLIPVHWKPLTDGTLLRYLNIDEDLTMQSTVNLDQKLLSARDIKV